MCRSVGIRCLPPVQGLREFTKLMIGIFELTRLRAFYAPEAILSLKDLINIIIPSGEGDQYSACRRNLEDACAAG